jgi:Arc/MetJ-type ribon-helix-helix transcriptional regulator
MKNYEDEAFDDIEKAQQRKVAHGVTDGRKLGTNEVLRVMPDGEFIWHPEADAMIEKGDFSNSPALPHMLRVLRKSEKKDAALRQALDALGAYLSATDEEEDAHAHSLMADAFFKLKEALGDV